MANYISKALTAFIFKRSRTLALMVTLPRIFPCLTGLHSILSRMNSLAREVSKEKDSMPDGITIIY
jgi:hypothetical protein